jgi:Domain of unknown function (DUF4160)
MPTVLRWRGYRFHFYSDETGERPHVHVRGDDKMVKIWLDNLDVAVNYGFPQHEVNVIRRQVDCRVKGWHGGRGCPVSSPSPSNRA